MGRQEARESLLEGTMVPMIPRWATISQQKSLSRVWRKSPTIRAKAEGEVRDRAHNNPRVIGVKERRRGHKSNRNQLKQEQCTLAA
ncbi:hypothetical protein C2S51_035390 [Perilla frutescens var. frutescens]|nr:hypothetical protein C2S51_035390 [Perilla frutescens var. frutescens]